MSGVFLNPENEAIRRTGFAVSPFCGRGGLFDPGQRRVRIGVAVDHEQWSGRKQMQQSRTVELNLYSPDDAVVKFLHEF